MKRNSGLPPSCFVSSYISKNLTQEHNTRGPDTDRQNARKTFQGELLTENKLILLSQPTEIIYLQFQGNDNFLWADVHRIMSCQRSFQTCQSSNKLKDKRVDTIIIYFTCSYLRPGRLNPLLRLCHSLKNQREEDWWNLVHVAITIE